MSRPFSRQSLGVLTAGAALKAAPWAGATYEPAWAGPGATHGVAFTLEAILAYVLGGGRMAQPRARCSIARAVSFSCTRAWPDSEVATRDGWCCGASVGGGIGGGGDGGGGRRGGVCWGGSGGGRGRGRGGEGGGSRNGSYFHCVASPMLQVTGEILDQELDLVTLTRAHHVLVCTRAAERAFRQRAEAVRDA